MGPVRDNDRRKARQQALGIERMTASFGPVDLTYGDITVNFCDPTFQIGMQYGQTGLGTLGLAQRIAAYALFANRVIVPSRYLLQNGDTFDAISQMLPLLEDGIVVPDLRQDCDSFVSFVENGGAGRDDGLYEEHLECARFLYRHLLCSNSTAETRE